MNNTGGKRRRRKGRCIHANVSTKEEVALREEKKTNKKKK